MVVSASIETVAADVLASAPWLDVARSVWRDAYRRAACPEDLPTRAWAMQYLAQTYPHAPTKRDLRAFAQWVETPEFSAPPPSSRIGSSA